MADVEKLLLLVNSLHFFYSGRAMMINYSALSGVDVVDTLLRSARMGRFASLSLERLLCRYPKAEELWQRKEQESPGYSMANT